MTNWVYKKSDGEWQLGDHGRPDRIHSEPRDYAMADLNHTPDPIMERYDGNGGSRPATVAEQNAYQKKLARARFAESAAPTHPRYHERRMLWRCAKKSGAIPPNTTFAAFLNRLAADR